MLRAAVAEDNPRNLERILGFLKRYGEGRNVQIEVSEYTDGSELLNHYRSCYDVVVFDNATLVTTLRNASHDILYTVVNSSAMNGIDENVVVKKVLPLWQYWLIAFDIVIAVIIIDGVVLVVRRCKKNNGIEIVVEENK